ncbi:hypothetical protein [Labrys sp. (in: a-proteobacteria)]|uniref:hypothetical protein n=1 Tax=Labrys sp. (in: a-proteobacteria) TaxID=1917972 RepID=UPI0039E38E1A
MGRFRLLAVTILLALLSAGGTALAEVRFGRNVFIGGHDFSNRRYGSVHIETTTRRPPWYGCRWYRPGSRYQGRPIRTRTQICNLRQIPSSQRRW